MKYAAIFAVLLVLVFWVGCASDEFGQKFERYGWPDGSIRHERPPKQGSAEWNRLKGLDVPPRPTREP